MRDLSTIIVEYSQAQDADLYIFNGPIEGDTSQHFVSLVCNKKDRRKHVFLFLTTHGGDPHAAYRMAKTLRRKYPRKFRLLVAGPCKSAGTLIALGASEIAFGPRGELGPLDVQMTKPDEIFVFGSGLDVLQAVSAVTDTAFRQFETYMVQLASKSGGSISTKTASEIASQFATGLFNPIMAQIDPLRLGETQRAITIATEYGQRLSQGLDNLQASALDRLIVSYPSHGFVIDLEEAQKLFVNVSEFSSPEFAIATGMSRIVEYVSDTSSIFDLVEAVTPKGDANAENRKVGSDAEDPRSNGEGESGDARSNGGASTQTEPAIRALEV
jgi:hypothetical protein